MLTTDNYKKTIQYEFWRQKLMSMNAEPHLYNECHIVSMILTPLVTAHPDFCTDKEKARLEVAKSFCDNFKDPADAPLIAPFLKGLTELLVDDVNKYFMTQPPRQRQRQYTPQYASLTTAASSANVASQAVEITPEVSQSTKTSSPPLSPSSSL